MKKYILILILLIMPLNIYAADYAEINGTTVRVRDAASTSGKKLGTYDNGARFLLKTKDTFKDVGGGCDSGYWYQVDHYGTTGYICTSFAIIVSDTPQVIEIDPNAKSECEKELSAKGFPSSYWDNLCVLKVQHPNWTFNAINTGYDFPAAVASENCKNSISTSASEDYKDTTCGKAYDTGYTGASQKAVAYYMNPLNFLDEKNIFMFESNYTNASVQAYYANATKKILPTTLYFVGYIPNIYTYISNATSSGVSAPAIAARIRQEIGGGDLGYTAPNDNNRLFSVLSGNYSTRYPHTIASIGDVNNYYNFYNIAAYDGTNVTQKALIYAKNHGWGGTGNQDADRQKAVTEGAAWIYRNYTNAGQQTIYFNKFNVNPKTTTGKFTHQYMTNIDAPVSEAKLVYNGYSSAGAMNQALIFDIPIYTNLSGQINNNPGGATGDTGNDNTGLSPQTMVVSSGLTLDGTTIKNIKGNTNISDIKGKIQSQGGTVNVYSGNNEVNDGLIGTGMIVKVTSSTGTVDFSVVVKGDPSGDGKVNALDLLQIQKYILGQKSLTGAYLQAADTSGDGKSNALDLLQVQKNILGQKEL